MKRLIGEKVYSEKEFQDLKIRYDKLVDFLDTLDEEMTRGIKLGDEIYKNYPDIVSSHFSGGGACAFGKSAERDLIAIMSNFVYTPHEWIKSFRKKHRIRMRSEYVCC